MIYRLAALAAGAFFVVRTVRGTASANAAPVVVVAQAETPSHADEHAPVGSVALTEVGTAAALSGLLARALRPRRHERG